MATRKLGSVKRTDQVLVTSVDLAADVGSTVLPVANGGSGTGTYTDGQILIGQTSGNTLAKHVLSGDATMDETGVVTITSSVRCPKFVDGFRMHSDGADAFTVGAIGATSKCADSTGAATITFSGKSTVDMTSRGAINGDDSFTGTGTITVSGSTITGSGTAFTTDFGPRACTGTISSSGTTVTGTGTSFLDGPEKLAIGDLIGSAANGYYQVTAIASNTSCTIQAAPASAFSGNSFNVIENPTILPGGGAGNPVQVIKITSDTAMVTSSSAGAGTNVAFTIGVVEPAASMPTTNQVWLHAWVGTGGSGTGCFVSTQRTTPFGISGYNTYVRRIGSLCHASGSVIPFSQDGDDRTRTYQFECARNTNNTRVLTTGTATAWTAVVCAAVAPPTAQRILFNVLQDTSTGHLSYLRKRNAGSSTVSRNLSPICNLTGGTASRYDCICDGAQAVDYAVSNSAMRTTLDVIGYQETL